MTESISTVKLRVWAARRERREGREEGGPEGEEGSRRQGPSGVWTGLKI